jgi:hypothetical protein
MSDYDDPFSAAADPYPKAKRDQKAKQHQEAQRIALQNADAAPHDCQCGGKGPSLSRRRALLGVGALTLLPAVAAASPFPVPCVQEKQQITPCRHKFCRHYAGVGDYHGR